MRILRSEKIKKTAAAIVCCGLCVSTGLLGSIAVTKMPEINGRTAFANGHVYLQDTTDSVEFYVLTSPSSPLTGLNSSPTSRQPQSN